jgi:hypothetical protein
VPWNQRDGWPVTISIHGGKRSGRRYLQDFHQLVGIRAAAEFSARHGWDLALLSEAVREKGESGRARRMATDALRCCERSQFPLGVGLAHRALGRALLAQGDMAEEAAALARACETFAAIEARYELARTRVDLARVAHELGTRLPPMATSLRRTGSSRRSACHPGSSGQWR